MRGTPGTCSKQIKTKHMYNGTNLHKVNIFLDINTQNFTGTEHAINANNILSCLQSDSNISNCYN